MNTKAFSLVTKALNLASLEVLSWEQGKKGRPRHSCTSSLTNHGLSRAMTVQRVQTLAVCEAYLPYKIKVTENRKWCVVLAQS